MMTPDINPVELKVFLNHIYELKKGVRQMVLYTTNKRYEDFAVKRLRSQAHQVCDSAGGRRAHQSLLRQGGMH